MSWKRFFAVSVCAVGALGSSAQSVFAVPLSPIPKGTISIQLQTVATGLGAPDYGISPPGDTSRLFVVDQGGLLRVIQNGSLLPGAALNIQNLVQVAPVGTGPMNPAMPGMRVERRPG